MHMIRQMTDEKREHLRGLVDWVEDAEKHEQEPTCTRYITTSLK